MKLLYLTSARHLTRHPWQLLLALLGISLGVATVLAVDLANAAAQRAFALSAEAITGKATHRILGTTAGVPDTLYRDLRLRLDGAIAPVISGRGGVPDQPGLRLEILGLDPVAEEPFRALLTGGGDTTVDVAALMTQPGAVILSDTLAERLGLTPGTRADRFALDSGGERRELRLIGTLPARLMQGMENTALMDISTAQHTLGLEGRFTRIDLILEDPATADELRAWLPEGLRLVASAEDNAALARLSDSFALNLTAMSLLALLVGTFLIFNAISFSVVQRRAIFGRLRAIGVTGRELMITVIFEALLLGVAGTLLGLVLGVALGSVLIDLVVRTINDLYFALSVSEVGVDPISLLKGMTLGPAATLVAALAPAWEAARTQPVTAMTRFDIERRSRRAVPLAAGAGVAVLGIGFSLAYLVPGGVLAGFAGLFLVCIGAALLAPAFLLGWTHAVQPTADHQVIHMVLRTVRRNLSRLSVASAALMIALSATVGVGIMVNSFKHAVDIWLGDLLAADVYVTGATALQGDSNASLPADTVQRLIRHPQVTAHSSYRHVDIPLGDQKAELVAANLAGRNRAGYQFLDGAEGAWNGFDSADVLLISEPLAHKLALGVGDSLELLTPTGARRFHINAVFRDFGSEHGRLLMNRDRYAKLWGDDTINTVALFGPDGTHPPALIETLLTSLPHPDQVHATAAAAIHDHSLEVFDRTFAVTEVLRILAVGVAFIGVLSALMALQLERAREFAVMRALGTTRLGLARQISMETVFVGLIAGIGSVPTGMAMAMILIDSIQLKAFGWTMPFHSDPSVIAEAIVVTVVASLLAAAYPAWRAAMAEPAEALREE
ncbi:MAG: FtsX-like permease family protein [Gammaproteobacteria bacterium]